MPDPHGAYYAKQKKRPSQKALAQATNDIYARLTAAAGPSGATPGTYTPRVNWNLEKGGFNPPPTSRANRSTIDKLVNETYQTPMGQKLLFTPQRQLTQPGYDYFTQQKQKGLQLPKLIQEQLQQPPPAMAQMADMGGNFAASPIDAIMAAIASNETGGFSDPYSQINYNDPSGAFGKYQILGNNIPSWTQEALGRTLTPQQFLNDPAAQDATARYMMQKYLNDYGSPQAVARAWNAGPGYATNPNAVTGYVNKFNTALQQAMASQPSSNRAWVSPIAGANIGDEQFGWRTHPITGKNHYHGGIDLGVRDNAVAGTPIYSATGGKIIYAGYDGAWGNTYVVADDTGQYKIRYAHLDSLPHGVGTEVSPGMVLGPVGNTGYSTGPHLHFEITDAQGNYVDPRGLF